MLFAFRGIRVFQVMLAVAALVCGLGAVLALKAFTDDGPLPLLFGAIILGGCFLWLFTAALRAPTSFVAVSPERTRFRFSGFVDTVIDNRDIEGVTLVRHNPLAGLGVRTNFGGRVALVSAWGEVAEVTLRNPIRVWLVPKLIPVRAHRLRLSIRNPQKLAERFGPPSTAGTGNGRSPASASPSRMKRRGSRTR